MRYSLTINNVNKQVLALLNLLQETEGITLTEEVDNTALSSAQITELDLRRAKHIAGESKSYSWDEVKTRARAAK
jgi:hypothetical protein